MAHKRQVGISTYIIAVLVPALFMLVALNTLLQKSNSQVGTLEHELVGLHTLKDLSQLQFFCKSCGHWANLNTYMNALQLILRCATVMSTLRCSC